MLKEMSKIKMHSYPGMVAVVGVNGKNCPNFMAAGWHSYLSIKPAMYGVAVGKGRYTYDLLKCEGRFSINFLPVEHVAFIQYTGTVTGETVDKCSQFSQRYFMSNNGLPILSDAYLSYECKLSSTIPTGDHDWVIGDIEGGFLQEEMFLDNGLPDFSKLHIPLYLGKSTYVPLDDQAKQLDIKEPLKYK